MARFAVIAATAIATLSSVAQAHNYVVSPLAEFKAGSPGNGNWVAEFKPPFSGDVSNGKSFMALAKQNGFATVRAFIEDKGPDCGNTNPNAKAKAIPADKKVKLYRSMDHPGPCELYIGNTMVYHNDDCKEAWGGATPNIPVDWSSCKGTCQLRFYWLGLQDKGQRMQSYKNCIPVQGGGGGGDAGGDAGGAAGGAATGGNNNANRNTKNNNANRNNNNNMSSNRNNNRNAARSMDEHEGHNEHEAHESFSFRDLNGTFDDY